MKNVVCNQHRDSDKSFSGGRISCELLGVGEEVSFHEVLIECLLSDGGILG